MIITKRTTHAVEQGSEAWLMLREGYPTASEAPAALGVSKYVTRAELMRRKATGIAPDVDPATRARFAAGHAAEAAARPLAEQEVGGDLYAVTMTAEVDGLKLLASLDGLTMDDAIAWETKLWNEELAAAVRAGQLPAHYTVQMDQELLVSGAKRCLFTCTDGTPERYVSCWYEADEAKFQALLDGWRQFLRDLDAYTPTATEQPARAEHMESLPAVSVRLDGVLSVVGNLPTFSVALREFIAKMPQRPVTDADFATTEAACKALKKAEEALDAAEAGALASIADVDAMRRAVADCRKLARDTRLAAEKMVERRKAEVKEAAVLAARKALDDHIADLNGELAPMRLLPVAADFAGAIKGLRSISSMQDALDTTLAQAKIAADGQARGIRANVATFKAHAEGLEFLFADLGQIVHKAGDDFTTLVHARIAQHRAAEAAREAKRKADEEALIAAALKAQQEAEVARAEAAMRDANRIAMRPADEAGLQSMLAAMPQPPAGYVAPRTPEPKPAEVPTLTIGAINERLGICSVTGAQVADLGVHGVKAPRGPGMLFTESQYQQIVDGLIMRLSTEPV